MIPMTEVVIQNVMTRARPHGLCCVAQCVVRRPDTLWAFPVCMTDAVAEIEGKLFVIPRLLVAFFVKLGNKGNERYGVGRFELIRPVICHAAGEVCVPLARDIIAEDDAKNGAYKTDGGRSREIHYTVPSRV